MSATAFLSLARGAVAFGQARGRSRVIRQTAERERVVAQQDALDFRRRQEALLASGRAARGASGVTRTGSALLVDDATLLQIALGESRILEGGDLRAGRLDEDARATDRAGFGSLLSAGLGAGSTFLTEPPAFFGAASEPIGGLGGQRGGGAGDGLRG